MKYLLWAVAIFISSTAMAQVKEGKVIYECKMNMHKDMPPEAEQFRALVPECITSKMEVFFNGAQSLFHAVASDDEAQMPQACDDGNRGIVRIGGEVGQKFYPCRIPRKRVQRVVMWGPGGSPAKRIVQQKTTIGPISDTGCR